MEVHFDASFNPKLHNYLIQELGVKERLKAQFVVIGANFEVVQTMIEAISHYFACLKRLR